MQPIKHTTNPITTGGGVIGIKYKDGILLASDTMGSYGYLERYMNVPRIHVVGDTTTAITASGELSDYQYICDALDKKVLSSALEGDGFAYTARELWNYLERLLYSRRNDGNPLWNTVLVAGAGEEELFLGQLDMYGTAIECDYAATGFGLMFALPLIREGWRKGMEREEAEALVKRCLEVLVYRDSLTLNKFRMADVRKEGVKISEPFEINTEGKWGYGELAIDDPK